MHGQGTFTFANGSKYVSEWKDGKKHGQGTFTSPDGHKYVGEFKDNKFHGQGTFTDANSEYVGEFKDGKQHRRGALTFLSGTVSGRAWNGYFMNGDFVPNICTDMGLTKGTPEHGKCVLKLMDSVMSEAD